MRLPSHCAEIDVGEPAPPANLQHLIEIELVDGDDDMACGEQREAHQLPVEAGLIEILQGVVEIIVPQIDEHADIHQREVERD